MPLALLVVLLAPVHGLGQAPAASPAAIQARAYVEAGEKLFVKGFHEQALAEFLRAEPYGEEL